MIEKIPEYLEPSELDKFEQLVFFVNKEGLKRAGMYFLLSCYTGFRLSDCMSFDYTERIKDNTIILRAKKNGKIISIPIHNKLAPVLDYIKENKPNMTEVNIRRNIKEICTLIGINRNIKFHTARHTFAMQLRVKGFSIDEIAELLGDTVEVARVYAQMYSPALNNAILKAFE